VHVVVPRQTAFAERAQVIAPAHRPPVPAQSLLGERRIKLTWTVPPE
jgi:hypothetical protein